MEPRETRTSVISEAENGGTGEVVIFTVIASSRIYKHICGSITMENGGLAVVNRIILFKQVRINLVAGKFIAKYFCGGVKYYLSIR